MSVIFYARVSTADQNLDHQIAQAQAAGFVIDEVIADHGVSGVSTSLSERPQGRRLFDKLRAGDTLVVRWVDRLGRNYRDVTDAIRHFIRQGVIIRTVINGMTFDGATSDPMQQAVRDSLISFMAAMAQAQAEVTKEAQKAGIAAAKSDSHKYPGKKPSYTRHDFEAVQAMLVAGSGASFIARETGLSRQTILRIKTDPVAAEAALTRWRL
ncbi:helix-turn-helix domain-containing protein [Shinella kummerowiae]|uniref:Helix-turn-helix domain-containing protein n=1 Tax=Shinella kummerowiae TaxID=417745 RepID=A0A6N8SCD2_9HYPH|nr:recombinase family protein [Shinella kummerowiae]MXN44642.1 helix-turn-helix domain-containing protein [Shinella kummerowiae]